MTIPFIQLENAAFDYHGTPVLQKSSIKVCGGDAVVVIGVSGSGKSTLLHLLHGQESPSSGVFRASERGVTALLSQGFPLYPHLTAQSHIVLALRRHEPFFKRMAPAPHAKVEAQALLHDVGLDDCAERLPHQLSGGQRQRVAIASALAMNRKVLLLDEPLSALDDPTREELQALLISLRDRKGIGWVLVTHDLAEALFLGERIYAFERVPGSTAFTLKHCPVKASLQSAPASKSDPAFQRSVDALRFWLADGVAPPPGMRRTVIRESDLAEIEASKRHVLVISPTLDNDATNPTLTPVVKSNLEAGKRYTYIYPAGNPVAEQNAATLRDRYAAHGDRVRFVTHDAEDPVFLFGEVVCYDPGTAEAESFTYLAGDSALMIAVPKSFMDGYLALLRKRGINVSDDDHAQLY